MHDLSVALQQAGLEWEEQGIVRLLAGLDLAHDGTVRCRGRAGGRVGSWGWCGLACSMAAFKRSCKPHPNPNRFGP